MLKAHSEALQAAEEEKEPVLAEAAGQAASEALRARARLCLAGVDERRTESATPQRMRLKDREIDR